MLANCWMGTTKLEVLDVPEPKILNDRDAIVRITRTAVCGSDLHLYDHYVPTMRKGDVLGHEFMGEVVEVGRAVGNVKVGDRVVIPFPIACGHCTPCQRGLTSLCENSNPNAGVAEKLWGYSPCGIFGYSHMLGGYAGGQAQYARVPFADFGALVIEDDSLADEQVLFLSDILPTGYMGAELCGIEPGDTIAVWGAGPVGQFAMMSAFLLGAGRVIAIDRFPYRLQMAAQNTGAEPLNYEEVDVRDALKNLTSGRGPDAVIDAVGMEAHHPSAMINGYDKARQLARATTERPHALRQAILACRNGGTVSVIGVYGGFLDKFPMGAFVNRALTMKSGQCHVHRYMRPLLEHIQRGDIDPTRVITHRMSLREAPEAYETFKNKRDDCLKVVLTP